MFATIWDTSGGFTRVNVLVLTCLLGPDIIPWLAAKAAGSILVPPFTPHVHLAQAGIDLIVRWRVQRETHIGSPCDSRTWVELYGASHWVFGYASRAPTSLS